MEFPMESPESDNNIETAPTLPPDGEPRVDNVKPPGIQMRRKPGPRPKLKGADASGIEVMSDERGMQQGPVDSDIVAPGEVLPSGKQKLPQTPQLVAQRRREDQSISDWLTSIRSGGAAIKISVYRVKPTQWMGKNTKGFIETVQDMLTDEELKTLYGGGTFDLRVLKRNEAGQYMYWSSTTVEVSGDPRIDNLPGQGGMPAQQAQQQVSDPMTTRALGILDRELERARDDNRRPVQQGTDMAAITMAMEPLRMQVDALMRQLDAKDKTIADLMVSKDRGDPFQTKMLDKLIDGDSARVEAVRTALTSEVNQAKAYAIENEKRLRDQFDRDLKQIEIRHQREMDQLKASYDRTSDAFKMLGDTQKEVLQAQVRSLERENTEMRSDIKALREKKDPSLLDKAKELEAVKNALGGDEAAEKSTLEKVADAAMSSDKLFEFLGKWVAPKAGAQPGQQQQQIHNQQAGPKFVRQRSTGNVFQRTPNGDYVPVQSPRKKKAPPVNAAGGQGEAAEADAAAEEIEVTIDPAELSTATAFLEMAFKNNVPVETVVTSARSAVPEAIMVAIRDLGIDQFLTKVVKLPASSPLATQKGRNWSRQLAKALLGEE